MQGPDIRVGVINVQGQPIQIEFWRVVEGNDLYQVRLPHQVSEEDLSLYRSEIKKTYIPDEGTIIFSYD